MVSKKTIWASIQYLRKFKDISKAVQLVAIAKLRKLNRVSESREYALSIATELFNEPNREYTAALAYSVVIVTSERSCCGKLNSDVLSAAKEAINSLIEDTHVVSIISIGWKGKASLSSRYRSEITHSIEQYGSPSMHMSYVVMLSILESEYDICQVYFSKYYKISEQVAACYEYVSSDSFVGSLYRRGRSSNICSQLLTYSFSELQRLHSYQVCLILLDSSEETRYSELGCRAYPTEMAHRNASESIQELLLVYNKARQSPITTEPLEVVSGALHA